MRILALACLALLPLAAAATTPAIPAVDMTHRYTITVDATGDDPNLAHAPTTTILNLAPGEDGAVENGRTLTYTKGSITRIEKGQTITTIDPGTVHTGYRIMLSQSEGDHLLVEYEYVALSGMQKVQGPNGTSIELPSTENSKASRVARVAPGERVDFALTPTLRAHIERTDNATPVAAR